MPIMRIVDNLYPAVVQFNTVDEGSHKGLAIIVVFDFAIGKPLKVIKIILIWCPFYWTLF